MTWEGWFTLGVIALCFSLLALGKALADIFMVGGLLILPLVGIPEVLTIFAICSAFTNFS